MFIWVLNAYVTTTKYTVTSQLKGTCVVEYYLSSAAVNLVLRCIEEVVPNLEYVLSLTCSTKCRREGQSSIFVVV